MGTWWNRPGERCPWATCFWGSVLVPLGPVSFICISFLLYPQPPTLSLKDTLDKLSDQGMLDSQWLPTQLSWKERQAIENLQPVFLGSSLIEEEGKGQRWVSYITVFNRLSDWSLGVVAGLDIVHSVGPVKDARCILVLISVVRGYGVHSHVRGWDKPCNPCWGLNCCYKWIMKLLPAAVALGTRAHTGGPSLICSHAPYFRYSLWGHSLSISSLLVAWMCVCHISVEIQRRKCPLFFWVSQDFTGDSEIFDIDCWRMSQNS